jgi:hypothetical protein
MSQNTQSSLNKQSCVHSRIHYLFNEHENHVFCDFIISQKRISIKLTARFLRRALLGRLAKLY